MPRSDPQAVTRLSIALPPPLAESLRTAARARGITVTAAVTEAVERWVQAQ